MDEQPDDDGRGRVQSGLAWALVGAAALPVVLAGDVARRILGGELDDFYGSGGIEPVTLMQRWDSLQLVMDPEAGALASALGLAVVAALVVAGRPGFLVPPRPARWLAVGVGAVTTLVALGLILGTLAYAGRTSDDPSTGYYNTTPDYLTLAPRVGLAVLAVVLAVSATAVLLRPPPPPPSHPPLEDGEHEPAAAPVSAGPPAEPAEPAEAPAVARDEGQHRPLREEALPGGTAAPASLLPDAPPQELPRLREDDLVLYQRPR